MTSPDPKGTYNPLNKASAAFSPIEETAVTATPIVTSNKAPHCTCCCKCFGFFRYDEWPNLDTYVPEQKLQLPKFGEADIQVLYRDKIKVFYKTAREA